MNQNSFDIKSRYYLLPFKKTLKKELFPYLIIA